jgi:predicted metal-dependent hydrolase
MIYAYDTLMDSLAALAIEAVCTPVAAVQSYWLILVARQAIAGTSLTLGGLRRQAQEETVLSMPCWAQSLASQALERLWREGVWWDTPGALALSQVGMDTDVTSQSQVVGRWKTAYQPYIDEILDYVCRIWQAARRLYGSQTPDLAALPEEVRRGVVLFEAGLYFACHEYFETLWGRTGDKASDLYQGIIQVAVAMRHLESHNVRGAIILLRYGMGRLQRYPAVYQGLPLAAWLERLETLLTHLETLPTPTAYQFDARHVPRMLNCTVKRVTCGLPAK